MTIALTDIPAAVDDYLRTQVTTTISPVTPTDPDQDVLTPGQEAKVTLTATNGDATTGVRLVNPIYHFAVDDQSVLTLIAPGRLVLAAFGDQELKQPIDEGAHVKQMFVVSLINNVLDAGEQGEATIHVLCKDQGSTTVIGRVLGKVDPDALFPTSHTRNHDRKVEVR